MTEEEYFRKNYPDFCYGDKPLSPHWDLFQYGVEFGERESEKRIAELEHENKVLAQNLEDTEIVNKALEKENAELKNKYVKNITDCDICDTYCNSQFTKAKEIIREFVEWATWQGNSKCPSFKDIQDKAEQFLNSEEK